MVLVYHPSKCTLLENGALPWWDFYSLLLNRMTGMTQVCPNKSWNVSEVSCKISHLANKQTKIFKINWSFSTFPALFWVEKFLTTCWHPGFFYFTMPSSTVHCSMTWPQEDTDDIQKQRVCLSLLSLLHSLFIWKFCHDCMLNWLWTWINCCNW